VRRKVRPLTTACFQDGLPSYFSVLPRDSRGTVLQVLGEKAIVKNPREHFSGWGMEAKRGREVCVFVFGYSFLALVSERLHLMLFRVAEGGTTSQHIRPLTDHLSLR